MPLSWILAAVSGCALSAQGGVDSHAKTGIAREELVLEDFRPAATDGQPTRQPTRLGWSTVLDGVMGGRSSGRFQIEDGVLRFRGVLNTNGGGFSSIRSGGHDLDLSRFAGVHLRVRGDGRRYSVRLEEAGQRRGRRPNYRGEFDTVDAGIRNGASLKQRPWQEVYVPFEAMVPTWRGRILDLPGIDPSGIGLLGVTLADGIDGPFAIDIESITAYRSFDMADLKGERRALVVFGPDAADMGVLRLLVDLDRQRAGVTERALSVIVVLEDGPSRVGPRPLASSEVAALRQRFGVEPGRFTAVLVGKDGMEKHRSGTDTAAAPWFARIDAMPMRQREMEQQSRQQGG